MARRMHCHPFNSTTHPPTTSDNDGAQRDRVYALLATSFPFHATTQRGGLRPSSSCSCLHFDTVRRALTLLVFLSFPCDDTTKRVQTLLLMLSLSFRCGKEG